MPYVPSKKTDGKSADREIIDAAAEILADKAAGEITDNLSVIDVYGNVFLKTARALKEFLAGQNPAGGSEEGLAKAIYEVAAAYDYQGAYLGEFNYAFTRFIQRVPAIMVEKKRWDGEFRYWIYAATVSALISASRQAEDLKIGLEGVLEDIKDEYKRRVNTAYEAAQILKSGDCYETPYYTKVVEVVDEAGNSVGHMEIMLKRGPETIDKDILDGQLVLKSKS